MILCKEKAVAYWLLLASVLMASSPAIAGQGDAVIQYNLALAAEEESYMLMKKACMASDGVADACLAWAELAEQRGNDKDVLVLVSLKVSKCLYPALQLWRDVYYNDFLAPYHELCSRHEEYSSFLRIIFQGFAVGYVVVVCD